MNNYGTLTKENAFPQTYVATLPEKSGNGQTNQGRAPSTTISRHNQNALYLLGGAVLLFLLTRKK